MSNKPGRKVAAQQAKSRSGRTNVGRGSASTNGSRLWLVLGGLIAVAIAAGIAIASSGGDDRSTGELEVGFAETIGDPLPPHRETPSVGRQAPKLRAQSMWTGDVVDIDVDNGDVQLIGFFAHWCPHCQREVPKVTEWFVQNGVPEGVEVVAVSTSVDSGSPNYPPSAWFSREGWPHDVLVDTESGALATGYGLSGFPYWVVVGPDGRVAEQASGEMTDAEFDAFMARAAALTR